MVKLSKWSGEAPDCESEGQVTCGCSHALALLSWKSYFSWTSVLTYKMSGG